MPRGRGLAALVVTLLIYGGCAESADELDEAVSSSEPPRPPPDASPAARLRDVQGQVEVAGTAAQPGSAVSVDEPISVPVGGSAALQLADGGRVSLFGQGEARVTADGGAQLLLIAGSAHLVQPAAGNTPRAPLRVVTPSATLELTDAAEAFVALLPNGASWVVVLSGAGSASNGEADYRHRLRVVTLAAGQSLVVNAARITEPAGDAPRRVSEARAALGVVAEPTADPEAQRLPRELAAEAQRVDQALRWLETETRRGRELTSEHAAAVRGGQAEPAQRLERALTEHAQGQYRLRQLATARWERLRAQALRLEALGVTPAMDPVAARRERAASLLGF
jgi:hypothetical protein